MKGRILLLVTALGAGGCATPPKSSTELVERATTVQDYCYQLPRQEVTTRIVDLLSKCYGPVETGTSIGAVYAPIKTGFQVIREVLANGNRYSVRNQTGFFLSADVLDGDEYCETRMHLYAISGFRDLAYSALDRAVDGQETGCP